VSRDGDRKELLGGPLMYIFVLVGPWETDYQVVVWPAVLSVCCVASCVVRCVITCQHTTLPACRLRSQQCCVASCVANCVPTCVARILQATSPTTYAVIY
jgi:hypothetical protein